MTPTEKKMRNVLDSLVVAAHDMRRAIEESGSEDGPFDMGTYAKHITSYVDALTKLANEHDGNYHATNIEFVESVMDHSNYGALAQLFVIDALGKWSDKIAACTPEQVDTPFINGEAWVGVAREIQAKLAARNKR